MKMRNIVKMTFAAVLAAMLVAGCAKKPAPSDTMGSMDTGVTQESTQQDTGFQEQAIQETPAAETMTQGTQVTGLERVFFDFDQYTLTPEAREVLANNAIYMKNNPGVKVVIEGHCDERGSDEYNLALGERRAAAAKSYMVSLGIPADRMTIISYGEEIPLDPRNTEEAWAKNRRAEFKAVR